MANYRAIWENCIPHDIAAIVAANYPNEVVYKKLVEPALQLARIRGVEIKIPKEYR